MTRSSGPLAALAVAFVVMQVFSAVGAEGPPSGEIERPVYSNVTAEYRCKSNSIMTLNISYSARPGKGNSIYDYSVSYVKVNDREVTHPVIMRIRESFSLFSSIDSVNIQCSASFWMVYIIGNRTKEGKTDWKTSEYVFSFTLGAFFGGNFFDPP